jgi:hypothetical protein
LVVKNYNPITGKEVKELMLAKLSKELDLHPDLSETLSYPKAVVEFRLRFDIHQWPFEEERHKLGDIHLSFTNDLIPPDAQRILSNMPVPTPTRISGSGLDGGATVVDEMVKASDETVKAVKEQYERGEGKSGAGSGGGTGTKNPGTELSSNTDPRKPSQPNKR